MGRERHPAPVVAALSATPGLVAEEPRLWRSCEGDGTLGARHLESRRARGVRSDLAREPSPALLRVEVKPMQLVALPSPFVSAGDGGRHSGLHSQGNPARQGRRRLANDGREHPLIEARIGRPVFHKENDNV